MIRFCDKEICCVTENQMDWQQMVDYFLDYGMDEKIYFLDGEGKYVGRIDYNSLFGMRLEKAINKEKVILEGNKDIWIDKDCAVLDEKIWENGRKYFAYFPESLLPVLNKEHELICFACNDEEANREIRMLDEVTACKDALDFREIFPDTECVSVNGFNELAYYFVQYLKKMDMPVNVSGEFWDLFGTWEQTQVPDYKNYTVNGEKRFGKLEEQAAFRESASAEFECIDQIYEENIVRGLIKDEGGDFQYCRDCLAGKKIVITETDEISLDAYDLLLGYGLDIYCFISKNPADFGKMLFGKEVKKRPEVMEDREDLVFVSAQGKYSAWGGVLGEADFYHYLGFKRNESYFLLQDYLEIPDNGYLNILNHILENTNKKLILTGDFWLSLKLGQALEAEHRQMQERIVYYDMFGEYQERKEGLGWIDKRKISEGDICLLMLPEYSCNYEEEYGYGYRSEMKKKYLKQAELDQLLDIADYPINNAFFRGKNLIPESEKITELKVKRIVVGAIEYKNGNFFFKGLVDNHPQILMMEYCYISENFYSLCIRLAMEKAENILSLLWKLNDMECRYGYHYEWLAEWEDDKKRQFNESMKKYLGKKEVFTSQELFVMIHIAYAEAWGKNMDNISNMVIYWEPHSVGRPQLEKYAEWLCGESILEGCVVNMTRDDFKRRGSGLSSYENIGWPCQWNQHVFTLALSCKNDEKKNYEGCMRMTIKFEDLKCNSKEVLLRICEEWGIDWSDNLLETTLHGQKEYVGNITGFDLTPVYRMHEKYFSPFDYFRITVVAAPYQKKYGYPYTSCLAFSRVQLRDMFMKEFRFEKYLDFEDDLEKKKFRQRMQKLLGRWLWQARREEIMDKTAVKEREQNDKIL